MTSWELARKIALNPKDGGMSSYELYRCFGTTKYNEIFALSEEMLNDQYNKWLKKRNIYIGSVILFFNKIAIVTSLKDNIACLLYTDGEVEKVDISEENKYILLDYYGSELKDFLKSIEDVKNE